MTLLLISSVRSSVTKEFFLSLKSFIGVSRKSNGCFIKYQGCFMQVSYIGSFKVVSKKFQESFNGVLREFQGCFREVLRMIQGSFRAV